MYPLWVRVPLLSCPHFSWHLFLVLPLARAHALAVSPHPFGSLRQAWQRLSSLSKLLGGAASCAPLDRRVSLLIPLLEEHIRQPGEEAVAAAAVAAAAGGEEAEGGAARLALAGDAAPGVIPEGDSEAAKKAKKAAKVEKRRRKAEKRARKAARAAGEGEGASATARGGGAAPSGKSIKSVAADSSETEAAVRLAAEALRRAMEANGSGQLGLGGGPGKGGGAGPGSRKKEKQAGGARKKSRKEKKRAREATHGGEVGGVEWCVGKKSKGAVS